MFIAKNISTRRYVSHHELTSTRLVTSTYIPDSSPRRCDSVMLLGKTLLSHCWASISFRGNCYTPRPFISTESVEFCATECVMCYTLSVIMLDVSVFLPPSLYSNRRHYDALSRPLHCFCFWCLSVPGRCDDCSVC